MYGPIYSRLAANKLFPVSTSGFQNRKLYFRGKTDVQIVQERVYWAYEARMAANVLGVCDLSTFNIHQHSSTSVRAKLRQPAAVA